MAIVNFVASRSLASGYALDDVVQLVFDLQQLDRTFSCVKESHKTLSGRVFQRVIHEREEFSIKIAPEYSAGFNAELVMFLDSVSDGTIFTADWNSDTTGNETPYIIEEPYTTTRLHAQIFEYSFIAVSQ